MNPYGIAELGTDTADAVSLRARLMAWHDAMVTHERRLRSDPTADFCGDECPRVSLWLPGDPRSAVARRPQLVGDLLGGRQGVERSDPDAKHVLVADDCAGQVCGIPLRRQSCHDRVTLRDRLRCHHLNPIPGLDD